MSKPQPSSFPLWWLIAAASVGALLLALPPFVASQFERAERLGEIGGPVYLGIMVAGGTLLVGCVVWMLLRVWRNTRDKQRRRESTSRDPSEMSASDKRRELEENLAEVRDFQDDHSLSPEMRKQLDPLVERVERKSAEQSLEIVAFGTISSGKSSLLNALAGRDVFQTDPKGGTTLTRNVTNWPGAEKVTLVDTPGLGEVEGPERHRIATEAARDADVVLLVVDGPLRESEFMLVEQLARMEKRILVCLNKEDWYNERDREALLGQISQQVAEFIEAKDVITVRSRPVARTRVKVSSDGQEVPEEVVITPDIRPLAERMMQVVKKDGTDLLLANLLLQSRGLVEEAKRKVSEALDREAWQIVDRYAWGAGGAAAVSPLPVVDLAAGIAISSKMVLDLARVYRQSIDADAAVRLMGQMGKQLIGVLGVSAATPAVVSAVASLLKTVPGAGTLAGGVLQGLVVALVTRWIGAVFIEYFRNQMQEPPGGLAAMARRQWQQLTSLDELKKLIRSAGKLQTERSAK